MIVRRARADPYRRVQTRPKLRWWIMFLDGLGTRNTMRKGSWKDLRSLTKEGRPVSLDRSR